MTISSRLYLAKDYVKALEEKERTGAIMKRVVTHMGPCYEVIYLPVERSPYKDID